MMADLYQKKKAAEAFLEKARTDAGIMRSEAEQERENILEDARQQADTIRADARSAGHEEGTAAGREEGIAQIREEQKQIILDANAKAEKTMTDAKEESHAYVLQAENEIASLAMDIVDKVLPQHFIDVPQMVLPVVRDAILRVKDQKEIVVHIPPESYDFVLMARDELRSILTAGDTNLTITSDEGLKPGDCLVETPNGNVDARLQTQIEQLKKAVREVML